MRVYYPISLKSYFKEVACLGMWVTEGFVGTFVGVKKPDVFPVAMGGSLDGTIEVDAMLLLVVGTSSHGDSRFTEWGAILTDVFGIACGFWVLPFSWVERDAIALPPILLTLAMCSSIILPIGMLTLFRYCPHPL